MKSLTSRQQPSMQEYIGRYGPPLKNKMKEYLSWHQRIDILTWNQDCRLRMQGLHN
jgi:hypothetical protein